MSLVKDHLTNAMIINVAFIFFNILLWIIFTEGFLIEQPHVLILEKWPIKKVVIENHKR